MRDIPVCLWRRAWVAPWWPPPPLDTTAHYLAGRTALRTDHLCWQTPRETCQVPLALTQHTLMTSIWWIDFMTLGAARNSSPICASYNRVPRYLLRPFGMDMTYVKYYYFYFLIFKLRNRHNYYYSKENDFSFIIPCNKQKFYICNLKYRN